MQSKRVHEISKSAIDTVVFTITEYKDKPIFDIRLETTTMNGEKVFTPKGIAMAIERLPEFVEGVNKLLREAKDMGLIHE